MKFKNLLITGGSGFIGTNFIEYLIKKKLNIKIINVDKKTYASNNFLNKKYKDFEIYKHYKIDINNEIKLEKILKKHNIDCLINFAAESHVDNSILYPENFLKSNTTGVVKLLKLSLKYKIHFHQISTDEVYGDLPLKSNKKFELNDNYKPSSPYSASKASADLFIKAFSKTYGLSYSISYCSNNYGKHQHKEKLIPKIISSCLNNKKIPIYGDGKNIRDWIYVGDHCEGIYKMLSNIPRIKEIMFGGGVKINNISLTNKIIEIVEKNTNKKNLKRLINFVKDRKGHDQSYQVSLNSSKKINWKPKTNLLQGLEKTVIWYLNNSN